MSANLEQISALHLKEVREIFFETSTKKTFVSEEEKEAFYYKYVGFYLEHYPDLCFVAVSEKVLGYVLGASRSHDENLYRIQPHMEVFEKYFSQYPAHLHINCHVDSRGRGIGGQLVMKLEDCLKTLKIAGLHIMTGPDSENQAFYKKLGFDFRVVENFRGSQILFMARTLLL